MDPVALLRGARTNVENYMEKMNSNVSKLEEQKRVLTAQLQEIEGSLEIIRDLKNNVTSHLKQQPVTVIASVPPPNLPQPPVPVASLPAVREDGVEDGDDDELELPPSILQAVTNAAKEE